MKVEEDVVKMRYGSLEFRKCSYLYKEPEVPSWEIVRYVPNEYYNKESEYDYFPNEHCYRPKNNPNHSIAENLFKSKEYCYTIAVWKYIEKDSEYELRFVGSRPINLSKKEREWFWVIAEHGEKQLNDYEED